MKLAFALLLFSAALIAVHSKVCTKPCASSVVSSSSCSSSSTSITYVETDICSTLGITVREYIPSILLRELEIQILEAKCRYLSIFDRYPLDMGPLLRTWPREKLIYDMVIVGTGSAVLNSIYNLAKMGKRILVIDRGYFPPQMCHSLYYRPKLFDTEFVTKYPVQIPGCKVPKYVYASNIVGGISVLNDNSYLVPPNWFYKNWGGVCPSWGWNNLQKYYKEIEYSKTKTEYSYEEETTISKDCYGRMYVSKSVKESYTSTQVCSAFKEIGYSVNAYDYNNLVPGFYTVPSISDNGRNILATQVWLESIKQFDNVHLALNSEVLRLEFESEFAKRVIINNGGQEIIISANDNVILGTGPINTYQILANSGVGCPKVLQSCGIKPVIPLPYMGHNFGAHPIYHGMVIRFPCGKLIRNGGDVASLQYLLGETTTTEAASLSFYNAFLSCGGSKQVNVQVSTYVFSRSMRQRLTYYMKYVWRYESHVIELMLKEVVKYDLMFLAFEQLDVRSRGYIRLNSDRTPLIELNMYKEEYDLLVMKDAINQMLKISQTSVFKQYNAELLTLPLSPSDILKPCSVLSPDYITSSLPLYSIPSIAPYGGMIMGTDINKAVVNEQLLTYGTKNLFLFGDCILPVPRWGHSIAPSLAIGKYGATFIEKWYQTRSSSVATSSSSVSTGATDISGVSLSEYDTTGVSSVASSAASSVTDVSSIGGPGPVCNKGINGLSLSEYESSSSSMAKSSSSNFESVSGGGYESVQSSSSVIGQEAEQSVRSVSDSATGFSAYDYSAESSKFAEKSSSSMIKSIC